MDTKEQNTKSTHIESMSQEQKDIAQASKDDTFEDLFITSLKDNSSWPNRKTLLVKFKEWWYDNTDILFASASIVLSYPDGSQEIVEPVSWTANMTSFLLKKLDITGTYSANITIPSSTLGDIEKIISFYIEDN